MPAGKGSPGKGGKAPAGKSKPTKGGARKPAPSGRSAVPAPARAGRGAPARAVAAVKAAPGRPARASEPPRLKVRYQSEVRAALQRDLGLPNPMLVPKMEKIVVNMGVGRAVAQPSLLEGAVRDLTLISGQKPVVTKAKKSIAAFKLRQGNAIGAKVTLRGDRMWEFFDRLVSLAIPRVRDFRGLSPKGFDGRGNYTFGLTEQLIFPEIDYDKVDAPRGMDVTIVTTARTDSEGRALLEAFGFPFRREGAA
jgi:large subunit ribosomal protein L5